MTDEQINAAIAEACGWNVTTSSFGIPPTQTAFSKLHGYDDLPNYCNDLNAMHEAEQMLCESTDMIEYTNMFYDIACEIQKKTGKWNPYGATPRQRAEAFLRTIGKWKEVEE